MTVSIGAMYINLGAPVKERTMVNLGACDGRHGVRFESDMVRGLLEP